MVPEPEPVPGVVTVPEPVPEVDPEEEDVDDEVEEASESGAVGTPSPQDTVARPATSRARRKRTVGTDTNASSNTGADGAGVSRATSQQLLCRCSRDENVSQCRAGS